MAMTETINGKTFEYEDAILHTTTTKLSLKDKIKVLLGKPIIVNSTIYTKQVVDVVHVKVSTSVPSLLQNATARRNALCN